MATDPTQSDLTPRLRRLGLACLVASGVLAMAAVVCYFWADKAVAAFCWDTTFWWHEYTAVKVFREFGKLYVVAGLVLLWGWASGRWRVVPVAILAAVLAGVAVIGVKHSVQRPRPKHPEEGTSTQPEQRVIQDYSFPSGDTATVFAATLAVLPFVGWRWGLIPLIVGAGVAVFRVFLLRHYASDVLAGVVVGLVSGWLVLWLARRRLGRAPPGRDT